MLKKIQREKLIFAINITPLTDVMLVLLVIFMVTTPFIIQGNIKINLPSANAQSENMLKKDIIIGITEDGKTFLNSKEVATDDELSAQLTQLLSAAQDKTVIIEGDKMALHGRVVAIMGMAKAAGAEKLAISTIPEEQKQEQIQNEPR